MIEFLKWFTYYNCLNAGQALKLFLPNTKIIELSKPKKSNVLDKIEDTDYTTSEKIEKNISIKKINLKQLSIDQKEAYDKIKNKISKKNKKPILWTELPDQEKLKSTLRL